VQEAKEHGKASDEYDRAAYYLHEVHPRRANRAIDADQDDGRATNSQGPLPAVARLWLRIEPTHYFSSVAAGSAVR
jgi:hypothetical protein